MKVLDPIRAPGFEAAKSDVIGADETAMLGSAGIAFGIPGGHLYAKPSRRSPTTEIPGFWILLRIGLVRGN